MNASDFIVAQALKTAEATSELTDREKCLIGLAVTLTRGCQLCTGGRIEGALKEGIPYSAVRAAIDLAAAVNAGVVLRTAIEGARRNNVNQPCTDPMCSGGAS